MVPPNAWLVCSVGSYAREGWHPGARSAHLPPISSVPSYAWSCPTETGRRSHVGGALERALAAVCGAAVGVSITTPAEAGGRGRGRGRGTAHTACKVHTCVMCAAVVCVRPVRYPARHVGQKHNEVLVMIRAGLMRTSLSYFNFFPIFFRVGCCSRNHKRSKTRGHVHARGCRPCSSPA